MVSYYNMRVDRSQESESVAVGGTVLPWDFDGEYGDAGEYEFCRTYRTEIIGQSGECRSCSRSYVLLVLT